MRDKKDLIGIAISGQNKNSLNVTYYCLFKNKSETVKQPIYEVKAVDTTAAGDTFTGYFLSSVIKGLTPAEALKVASKASSIAVSRMGAASSIPTLDEVTL